MALRPTSFGTALDRDSERGGGGGNRIHPEDARKSGGHGAQELAQGVGQQILWDVQGAVLALVVRR